MSDQSFTQESYMEIACCVYFKYHNDINTPLLYNCEYVRKTPNYKLLETYFNSLSNNDIKIKKEIIHLCQSIINREHINVILTGSDCGKTTLIHLLNILVDEHYFSIIKTSIINIGSIRNNNIYYCPTHNFKCFSIEAEEEDFIDLNQLIQSPPNDLSFIINSNQIIYNPTSCWKIINLPSRFTSMPMYSNDWVRDNTILSKFDGKPHMHEDFKSYLLDVF